MAELIKEAETEPDVCGSWDRDITLREYGRTWIEGQDHLEPKTLASYRHLLFSHVLDFKADGCKLGDMPIREIRRRHVKALVASKKASWYADSKKYSNNSVRLMCAVLSSLLTDAMDDEIIEQNPALMLFRKKKQKEKRLELEVTPMAEAEFCAFVEEARTEKTFGPFLITLGKTGLRPSEAVALAPEDVRLDRRVLRVEKAYVSGAVRPYTKNGVRRDVDLSPEMLVLLQAHIAKLREDSFRKGKPMPEMLFPNSVGKHIDWYDAARAFRRICKKVRIGPFRPYDLRHTLASLLLADGAPITYVAAQLGHRKPTTTLRYYARWLPKDGRRYVAAVDVQNRPEAAEPAAARE